MYLFYVLEPLWLSDQKKFWIIKLKKKKKNLLIALFLTQYLRNNKQ